MAGRVNQVILRHEGAHQLFHTYGVHSEQGVEHLWLIEGLATYFEERESQGMRLRVQELQTVPNPRELPFATLVNFASRDGINSLGTKTEIDLFYPKAWFVVDHLMRKHREPFFAYIRYTRDPANQAELRDAEHFETLSRFLELRPEELERELNRALGEILKPLRD